MGSHWPVESLNPFPIIQTGATRRTGPGKDAFFPNQALTLDLMLAGYIRKMPHGVHGKTNRLAGDRQIGRSNRVVSRPFQDSRCTDWQNQGLADDSTHA